MKMIDYNHFICHFGGEYLLNIPFILFSFPNPSFIYVYSVI